jgi:hypothetical protein
MGSLRATPVVIPALAAIALFVVWATSQAGYPLTHWSPGALIVLVLLAIALVAVPPRFSEIPHAVKLALVCFAAYTALSFLSIAWASAPGVAWDGANRTLLYMMVFALFALWPAQGGSAALLVGVWALAMIALATYVAARLGTSSGNTLEGLFSGERLSYPVGYPNATAALWLMAFWPALLLARGERLPWVARGLFGGGAVVLADVALLSLSRGSLYATSMMIVLVFVLIPQRLRTFAVTAPVALGIGATVPLLLRVGDRLGNGQSPSPTLHAAIVAIFLAALLVGAVVAAGAALESHGSVSQEIATRLRRGLTVAAVATLALIVVGGLVAAGNPVMRVRHGWESFEGGYSTGTRGGTRLLSGLGSNRYDFYRVALDQFTDHPLVGIGVDNFQQQYLRYGHSEETPSYPHSLELRTLAQTGVFGALLAVVGLGAALLAGWRAMRRHDDILGATVAVAALGGFAYWAVHGSFDWFWEFAGLGAPAFAFLGIACALTPVRGLAHEREGAAGDSAGRPRGGMEVGGVSHGGAARSSARATTRRILAASLGGLLALAAVASLAAPWLSEREVQGAARIWPKAPLTAYARLNDAAKLNPLSDRAYLVAGSIALRFGDLARAEREFTLALQRVPDGAYAVLELGAIASESGQRERSLELLERALLLDPRDPLTRKALRSAREGKRVSVDALNRSILSRAERLA